MRRLLVWLGLCRPKKWERPTLVDWFLDSPLQGLIYHLYLLILYLRSYHLRAPNHRQAIKVVCISDTHESIIESVPDGDLLIHCGDLTNDGTAASIQQQIDWLASLPHRHKVLVCGNHDSWFDINARREADALGHRSVDLKGIIYLEHKSVTLSFKDGRKLNIWGAPDVPQCGGPDNAFQYLPHFENPWKGKIPADTDILVTHTPPFAHRDLGLGCPNLLHELWQTKPTLHVFGHVHCGRGTQVAFWDECQRYYEKVMSRKQRGPIYDMLPHRGWFDAFRVLYYGALSIVWRWLWEGGRTRRGSLMVNAGMQEGTSGRLTSKPPFCVEI
ncbi:calcineurin-like phosphoesterase [Xylariomycetidae sp. FL2044]|nr:calcineurin-like phosphoesterase [Xylariomycetidae sp. FL2044]